MVQDLGGNKAKAWGKASLALVPLFVFPHLVVYAKTKTPSSTNAGLAAQPPFNANPAAGVAEMILGLCVVLLLAYLSIRFLGRKSHVRQQGSINIVAARQVAPNKSVQVIEIQGKHYLIGVGDQVTLLADVSESFLDSQRTSPTSGNSPSIPFAESLSRALESARQRYASRPRKGDDKR